jgi:glutaconate CoA-transferase subunit B
VDFVSMPGRRTCKELNFLGGGAKWIVTPKAIFDFDPVEDVARLAATFPGVTEDEVKKTTGFSYGNSPQFAPVPPPTKEELEVLRNEVDRKGVLRRAD